MFNDLNQSSKPAVPTPPVDDIFAETDKSVEAKNFSGYYANSTSTPAAIPNADIPTDIETRKAGLSASEDLPTSSKGKILKVGLIALLVVLLISLGYLVYVKFIAEQKIDEAPTGKPDVVKVVTPVVNTEVPTTTPVIDEVIATPTPPMIDLVDTDGDGLTDQEEEILGTNPLKADTDGDGLTDYEEVHTYKTDPLKEDSDGDGLSDYHEVRIYLTDPLIADTDGDGHNDGEEVNNGYNPLGDGKMIDAKKATTTILNN